MSEKINIFARWKFIQIKYRNSCVLHYSWNSINYNTSILDMDNKIIYYVKFHENFSKSIYNNITSCRVMDLYTSKIIGIELREWHMLCIALKDRVTLCGNVCAIYWKIGTSFGSIDFLLETSGIAPLRKINFLNIIS